MSDWVWVVSPVVIAAIMAWLTSVITANLDGGVRTNRRMDIKALKLFCSVVGYGAASFLFLVALINYVRMGDGI